MDVIVESCFLVSIKSVNRNLRCTITKMQCDDGVFYHSYTSLIVENYFNAYPDYIP
jgi:hypothetical protein